MSDKRLPSIPEASAPLVVKCPKCHGLLYHKALIRNLKVCMECGYHFRLSAAERIALLLDAASFHETDGHLQSGDPLHFVSASHPYEEKLQEERRKVGRNEAVVVGTGTIHGLPLALGVMEFGFIGGSMGTLVGEKITRIIERAMERELPLLIVSASGGARMQEGLLSLMQMAKTTAALGHLVEGGLPFISLLTDPTTGGVAASFASLGHVILAEPGALVSFAGPRVIEQFTHQPLPADAHTAEQALRHGMIDAIVPRRELRATLQRLLRLLSSRAHAIPETSLLVPSISL